METTQTRRPRLSMAVPQFDLGAKWRRHREVVLAQLGPVFGVLLLLCAALWAIGEYVSYKAELRRAETSRYLEQFQEPPVADAWRQLSVAWQAEQGRQNTLLTRISRLSGPEFEAALRNYRHFVLDTVEERALPPDIETVRAFFARLGVCLQVGSCDPTIAGAQFGPAVWQFRNQHYYYFADEGRAADVDQFVAVIAPHRPGERPASVALN